MAEKRIGDYWFKCPRCGSRRFEEVAVGVTVSTRIEDVGDYGDLVYGDNTFSDGDVERYQCESCRFHILDEEGDRPITEEDLLEVIYYNKTEFSDEVE